MYWVLLLYWVLLDTFTLAQDLCTLSTILYIPVARMMSFVALICRLQRADRYVKSLTCNWHYANYMQITTVACTTVTFGICGSIGGCNKMRDCIFILLTAKEKNHKPLPWLNMNKQVLTDGLFILEVLYWSESLPLKKAVRSGLDSRGDSSCEVAIEQVSLTWCIGSSWAQQKETMEW